VEVQGQVEQVVLLELQVHQEVLVRQEVLVLQEHLVQVELTELRVVHLH
jgi:hypothetical protein